MTHPFNKEKKAGDTAQAEANKEHATELRQEKNAVHTESGQAARQMCPSKQPEKLTASTTFLFPLE